MRGARINLSAGFHNDHVDGTMETREEALTRLREILERLGPGAWLTVDERWLHNLFGPDGEDQRKAATAFAQGSDCAFSYEPQDRVGIFGRAYTKLTWPYPI